MKKIFIILILCSASSFYGCKKGFLEEKPLDFLSSTNAFQTLNDFNASVYNLYDLTRSEFYNSGESRPLDYVFGTDLVYDGQASVQRHTNMPATYSPIGGGGINIPLNHWTSLYKIISEANTIISRVPGSSMTNANKSLTEARARFFRAMAYRTLVYLYGGVPLSLDEVTSPKTDFIRATKAQVLDQCIADLKFATANLPLITAVQDGEISNLVAYHLLAEVNIAAGKYQDAVVAATAVIGSADVTLMKTRFGSKSTVTPGDVYWDLFQRGNQNRKSGNREALWVIQFETDIPGGGAVSTAIAGSYQAERHFAPQFNNLRVGSSKVSPINWPVSDYSGGRGIGWAISTKYFSDVIWQSDFNNDIRNSNQNFVRIYKCTNPAHPLFGQTISTITPPAGIVVPNRFLYAYQSKVTTPGDHPEGLFADKSQLLLKATAGGTYTDQYMFRLAETYLLRAEAYFNLNDLTNAATDINEVRARAKASPVAPAAVNMDYILDERMRELGSEEKRRLTLMRTGSWYDRVKKCNPYYSDALTKYNVWPIPAAEIERTGGKLTQNPGY